MKKEKRIMIGIQDKVIREMLEECYGKGKEEEYLCVYAYFNRVREEIEENMGDVLIPGLGSMVLNPVFAWNKYKRGMLGIRDKESVAKKAIEAIRKSGKDDISIDITIKRLGLEEYESK